MIYIFACFVDLSKDTGYFCRGLELKRMVHMLYYGLIGLYYFAGIGEGYYG